MVTIMNTPGAGGGGSTGVTDPIAMVVGSPGGGLSGASDDDDDNCPSSPGSVYEEGTDLMAAAMGDEVTAQLAAAGTSNTHTYQHIAVSLFLYLCEYCVCRACWRSSCCCHSISKETT